MANAGSSYFHSPPSRDALSITIIPTKLHHQTMEKYLTADEILQLVNTGMVELTEDLILRMAPKVEESYEDSDWYNDPNCVMSKHHY